MPCVTIRVAASEGDGVSEKLMERAGRKATDILQEGVGAVLVVYRKCAASLYYDAQPSNLKEPAKS